MRGTKTKTSSSGSSFKVAILTRLHHWGTICRCWEWWSAHILFRTREFARARGFSDYTSEFQSFYWYTTLLSATAHRNEHNHAIMFDVTKFEALDCICHFKLKCWPISQSLGLCDWCFVQKNVTFTIHAYPSSGTLCYTARFVSQGFTDWGQSQSLSSSAFFSMWTHEKVYDLLVSRSSASWSILI